MKRMIALLLALSMLCGCAASEDLMEEITPGAVEPVALDTEAARITDFGVRLFQQSLEAGENTLVSPLSVLCALAMTANGAKGETLAQMEQVLGLDTARLNSWIRSYKAALPQSDTNRLHLANSLWIRDIPTFTVEQSFLQTNADYFGAGIYRAAFDDATCREINGWVKEHTDGMIDSILDRIGKDTVMYLINALAFDAQWQNIYTDTAVREGLFHLADAEGTAREVELMYSRESSYLEDDLATGFVKYYADREFAFVALLPKEGVSVEEYVKSLTGQHLASLLAEPKTVQVNAAIPRFETDYEVELSQALSAMGMPDAFNSAAADLSGIGRDTQGNLYINRVLHKTFICVDERGTKAGAVTAVEVNRESAPLEPEEVKTVILDRPFVYLLIDCESNLPFFMGVLTDVEG